MSEGSFFWREHMVQTGHFKKEDKAYNYQEIEADDRSYDSYQHCSHVMIYAKTKKKCLHYFNMKAVVLMQMRFDGYLGFPGGLVDPGETAVQAVNRELAEENNWKEPSGPVAESHRQLTHFLPDLGLVLHFFAVEVSESKMHTIEKNSFKASEYGNEVLGNIQVPLFTMGDAYRGFPNFLHNSFIGTSKIQLIETLVKLKIVTKDYVIRSLSAAPNMIT